MSALESILLYFREDKPIFEAMMQSKHKLEYLECINNAVYDGVLWTVQRAYSRFPVEYPDDTAKLFSSYVSSSLYGVLRRDLDLGITEDVETIIKNYREFHDKAYSLKLEVYARKAPPKKEKDISFDPFDF